jgi:hypothetical protein
LARREGDFWRVNFGLDNVALNPKTLRRCGFAACDGLWHVAPAATQKGDGGGDPRCVGILVPHDADQNLDCDPGLAAAPASGFRWEHLACELSLRVWRRPVGGPAPAC